MLLKGVVNDGPEILVPKYSTNFVPKYSTNFVVCW